MFDTDCVYHLYLSSGDMVSLLMHGREEVLSVSKRLGTVHKYEGRLPIDVYNDMVRAWKDVGVHVTAVSNYKLGENNYPMWYDATYGLTVWLASMYVRDRPDLGLLEGTTEHAWYLKLSRPLNEVSDDWRNDDELLSALVRGLHDHGFQWDTPLSAYSPTGRMFNQVSIHSVGRRAMVYNTWSLDC